MKENPAMHRILQNMKPGVISLGGFLGTDGRSLEEIIDHDRATLERAGFTPGEIADRLEEIRDEALKGFGEFVPAAEGLLARADSIRGKLPCPFEHPGLYRKTVVTVRPESGSPEFVYTDLGIHLIREHCFFQGKGSRFRLEPEVLASVLKKS